MVNYFVSYLFKAIHTDFQKLHTKKFKFFCILVSVTKSVHSENSVYIVFRNNSFFNYLLRKRYFYVLPSFHSVKAL